MNPLEIIRDWMIACCKTINEYDHAGHMNLISKDVKVFGIEGMMSLPTMIGLHNVKANLKIK